MRVEHVEQALKQTLSDAMLHEVRGRVVKVSGTIIKAVGISVKIGEICILKDNSDDTELKAEVVGFSEGFFLLSPMGRIHGISSSTEVIGTGQQHCAPVGHGLKGRILDGNGNFIDMKQNGEPKIEGYYPLYAEPPNPLHREILNEPISLGVKAIDGLMTCCEGMRMGIFAGAGVGKSTLLAMIARGTTADIIVLALIGERGREVREYIEHTLGDEGMKKSVVVVATSDRPALERLKAAYMATAIAEYFRDGGNRVLLMMDSVTRFARAQRELGLAAGEPATRRGYPPSLFSTLPLLMERPGKTADGSITALYNVLVEGEDMNEPVADETRSLLDGHIVLSSKLASANHYPAIDVLRSVSRVMNNVAGEKHREAAARLRILLAKYNEIELLVKIGEYKKGADALADEAIAKIDSINTFLKQSFAQSYQLDESIEALVKIVE